MPGNRPLVIEALGEPDKVTGSGQSAETVESGQFEDVEDAVDRWVSVGVFGAITLVLGAFIVTELSRSMGPLTLGTSVIALGFLELVLGTFGAYVVHPRAMVAVAVASAFAIADGVLIATGGAELAWGAGAGSLALGLGCAAVGITQAIRTWSALYREDRSAA
ncbi:MAG: hypothetical protein WB984_05100 [Thermoplasmata archaeon]